MLEKQSGTGPRQTLDSSARYRDRSASDQSADKKCLDQATAKYSELMGQNERLRAQIQEYKDILSGIRCGEVDAFVIAGPDGNNVLTVQGAELPLRVLVEAMADGAIMFSSDGVILYSNPRFSGLVGVAPEKIVGDNLSSFVAPADSWRFSEEPAQGCKRHIMVRSAQGNFVQAQLSICPLERGRSPLFCGIVTDLTETLAGTEARLRLAALVESSHDAIMGLDLDASRTVRSWNAGAERLYGYQASEICGLSYEVLIAPESKEKSQAHVDHIAHGAPLQQFEAVHVRKNGSRIDVSLTLSRLCDAGGVPVGISLIGRDVTERNKAQELIESSLQRNQVLLQEVHHRVKNNLQVVSSLLNLQADAVQDRQLHGMLLQARQRVYSMALIHDQLYQSESLARIDFAAYTRILANDLFESYCTDNRHLSLRLDLEPIHLSLDTAVPCGLILNELVCNCLKHAFPRGSHGCIAVSLHRSKEADQVALSVQDDGVGFETDYAHKKSLGFKIVNILSKQIHGKLLVENSSGGRVELTFPES